MVFFCLITSAFASETLNTLVNASAGFSTAILQQLGTVQGDPTPTKFAEKTISYAKAKTAYFMALREEVPGLMKIATGKEPRPLELGTFAAAFAQLPGVDGGRETLLEKSAPRCE